MEAKTNLDAFVQAQVSWLVRIDHIKFYRNANKPGRLLAHLVRSRTKSKPIISLKDPESNTLQTTTKRISEIFCKYYEDLYRASTTDSGV